jgi:hypothetical protein
MKNRKVIGPPMVLAAKKVLKKNMLIENKTV